MEFRKKPKGFRRRRKTPTENPTCGLRGSQACGEGDLYCTLQ